MRDLERCSRPLQPQWRTKARDRVPPRAANLIKPVLIRLLTLLVRSHEVIEEVIKPVVVVLNARLVVAEFLRPETP